MDNRRSGTKGKEAEMEVDQWILEGRADGVILVRVPSRGTGPDRLPDAVFTFRPGDPQYRRWEQEYRGQGLG
jgi:hypothetical protein